MISSVDRRSQYVENRARANVRLNNFLTPYTLDSKSSILNAPCGYSNGVYASLRPSNAFGPELVTHGTFDSQADVDYWQIASSRATKSLEDGFMRLTYDSTIGAALFKGNLVPTGRYKVTFRAKGTANTNFASIGDNASIGNNPEYVVSNPILTTDWQKYEFRIELTQSTFRFYLNSLSVGDTLDIDDISVKEDISADFVFERGTAATRVTKDGLIKDVQILSGDLVQNGNFEEIGPELISNGDFSQQGSELVTGNNSNFDSSTGDWQQFRGVMSWDSSIQAGKWTDNGTAGSPKGFTMSGGVIPTSSGKTYRVKFIAKTDSSSSFNFDWIGELSTFNTISNPNLTSDFQDYEFTFTASGNNQRLYIALNSSSTIGNGESYWIDNVSVVEVGQDWVFSSECELVDSQARIYSSDGSFQYIRQNNVLNTSKQYKLEFDVISSNGADLVVVGVPNAISTSVLGRKTVYFNPTSTYFQINRSSGVTDVVVDNISVKEVGQNWTFDSGWSMGDGVAKALDWGYLDQSLSTTSGSKYKVTFTISNYSSGDVFFRFTGNSNEDGTTRNANGTYTEEINLTNNQTTFRFVSEGGVMDIDNVSVIEITDDTNLPRIDYTNGTGALLLEPQSTNLVKSSEDFASANWVGFNYTITSNYAKSPDGSNNASRYVGSTTSQDFYIAVTVTSDYTYSCYVKAINAPFIRLRTTNGSCWFDMGNKTVGTNTFTGDANIEDAGNDWYRLSVTTSHTINSINAYIHAHATDNTTSELDGCEFLLWGAQLEQLPYASSYIPTNGSTVTRNKDQAYRSGISNLINSAEGVLYAEFSGLGNDSVNRLIAIADGSANNRVSIHLSNNNELFMQIRSGGVTQASKIVTSVGTTENVKAAVSYKTNDFSFWVNGVEVHTDSSGNAPIGMNRLGFDNGTDGVNFFRGRIRSVAVFNEALTDEELAKITSTTQQEVFYEMRDKMQQIDADYYEFGDYTTRLKKLF